eukprot:m.217232 g.217232  ORF g.217232 m.217232 type:complete len:113 (+) comp19116_c0_seq6:634-972(+)
MLFRKLTIALVGVFLLMPSCSQQVCTLGNDLREPYGTSEVADIVLPSSEGSEAIEHHLLVSGALAVHRGEMDFFDQGPWNYGSFTESTFHVFTPSAAVVRVGIQASGPSMVV